MFITVYTHVHRVISSPLRLNNRYADQPFGAYQPFGLYG
jgi:hypothetical protein